MMKHLERYVHAAIQWLQHLLLDLLGEVRIIVKECNCFGVIKLLHHTDPALHFTELDMILVITDTSRVGNLPTLLISEVVFQTTHFNLCMKPSAYD